MEILKKILPQNCFGNDTIIARNLFTRENYRGIIIFLEKYDNYLIKIFIDRIDDLEYVCYNEWRLIHFICCCSTPEMIKYIIDKGVDSECETNERWRPIHYICRYSTPEMIKYIIDKGVDLECEDNGHWRPIHFICCQSTLEMIKYLVDYSVNLNIKNNHGKLPIDYIKNKEMKGYVKAHMMYQSRDSEELMMRHLQNKNELYQAGFQMAIKKLFGKCNKNARK